MRKEYKVLICILALIFSIGATCIGLTDWKLFSEIWNEICVCFVFSDANNSYMLGCYRIAQKVSLLESFE